VRAKAGAEKAARAVAEAAVEAKEKAAASKRRASKRVVVAPPPGIPPSGSKSSKQGGRRSSGLKPKPPPNPPPGPPPGETSAPLSRSDLADLAAQRHVDARRAMEAAEDGESLITFPFFPRFGIVFHFP
tara:strand:+ start:982 stop:1368 length:387 start_codon:yes stop_codon:yes gene_type:complete